MLAALVNTRANATFVACRRVIEFPRGYDEAPVLRYDNRWSFSYSKNSRTPNRFPLRPEAYCTTRPHPICAAHRSFSLSPTVISSLLPPPPHTSDTTDYTGWLPWQKVCVSSFHFTERNLIDVALHPPNPQPPPQPSLNICLPTRLKFRQITYISVALHVEAFYITALLSGTHRHCINYSCLFRDVRKL